MASPVDIFLKDHEAYPLPVADVVAHVYTESGEFLTGTTSDSDGLLAFLLPVGSYELRFFKQGTKWPTPVRFMVIDDERHSFDVGGEVVKFTPSSDPNVCRVICEIVTHGNAPRPHVPIRFVPELEEQTPKVLRDRILQAGAVTFTTDANGRVLVDLPRGGLYWVSIPGEEVAWEIHIPDAPSARLADLISPYPVAVTWLDETGSAITDLSIEVGKTAALLPSITFSDHRTVEQDFTKWIEFENTHPEAATLDWAVNGVLVGISPGTTQITAKIRTSAGISRIPLRPLTSTPLTVTVTPST